MRKIKLLLECEVEKDFISSAAGMMVASSGLESCSELINNRIESGDPIPVVIEYDKEKTMFDFLIATLIATDVVNKRMAYRRISVEDFKKELGHKKDLNY